VGLPYYRQKLNDPYALLPPAYYKRAADGRLVMNVDANILKPLTNALREHMEREHPEVSCLQLESYQAHPEVSCLRPEHHQALHCHLKPRHFKAKQPDVSLSQGEPAQGGGGGDGGGGVKALAAICTAVCTRGLGWWRGPKAKS
jgi:hypothetical protein